MVVLPSCLGAEIVEWKTTNALAQATAHTRDAEQVIDGACRLALERYPAFLRSRGMVPPRVLPDSMPEISLLPGNIRLDGKAHRNLNDLPGRFGAVYRECCYWGLYVDGLNHLFVRNDPMQRDARTGVLKPNPRFLRTFFHEMAHVLNHHLGVRQAFAISRERDEELAEEFVTWLGVTVKTESSDEDLVAHRNGI